MYKWFIILFVLVCIGLMYGRFEGLTKLINPYLSHLESHRTTIKKELVYYYNFHKMCVRE